MYKIRKEACGLVEGLLSELVGVADVEICVCPTYTALESVRELLDGKNIELGAQNMFWEDEGAYTGAISGKMLKDAGCKYVIIGHSERRQYFGETEETVNKRLKKALEVGLSPILCIGEKLEEREAEKTFDVINKQLTGALRDFSKKDVSKMAIAYEPVWAIGTGKTATPEIAEEVHSFIREKLGELYDGELAEDFRILYGGSVKPGNVEGLMSQKDIDGALVGGASLKKEDFSEMVKKTERLYKKV